MAEEALCSVIVAHPIVKFKVATFSRSVSSSFALLSCFVRASCRAVPASVSCCVSWRLSLPSCCCSALSCSLSCWLV
ncbi:hypothetical protein CRX72_01585 [Pantoea sp. BRM17]|nr:hypothetical protein CRX72_01585 [Pantoea sp. BRM17]